MGTPVSNYVATGQRELVELGLSSLDAVNALDDNSEWFEEQFESGAFSGITANEWFTHYHDEQ